MRMMQLNHKKFVEEILNIDFKGNLRDCALALQLDPSYFSQVILQPHKPGGTKLLSSVYNYCKKTARDPEAFIFKETV